MGKISSLKTLSEDKNIMTLEVSSEETIWLKGNMEKMHLFSENNLEYETRLVQRGKKESTKYFLMPKEFRKGVIPSNSINCNRIETETKYLFIFAVEK